MSSITANIVTSGVYPLKQLTWMYLPPCIPRTSPDTLQLPTISTLTRTLPARNCPIGSLLHPSAKTTRRKVAVSHLPSTSSRLPPLQQGRSVPVGQHYRTYLREHERKTAESGNPPLTMEPRMFYLCDGATDVEPWSASPRVSSIAETSLPREREGGQQLARVDSGYGGELEDTRAKSPSVPSQPSNASPASEHQQRPVGCTDTLPFTIVYYARVDVSDEVINSVLASTCPVTTVPSTSASLWAPTVRPTQTLEQAKANCRKRKFNDAAEEDIASSGSTKRVRAGKRSRGAVQMPRNVSRRNSLVFDPVTHKKRPRLLSDSDPKYWSRANISKRREIQEEMSLRREESVNLADREDLSVV